MQTLTRSTNYMLPERAAQAVRAAAPISIARRLIHDWYNHDIG